MHINLRNISCGLCSKLNIGLKIFLSSQYQEYYPNNVSIIGG